MANARERFANSILLAALQQEGKDTTDLERIIQDAYERVRNYPDPRQHFHRPDYRPDRHSYRDHSPENHRDRPRP